MKILLTGDLHLGRSSSKVPPTVRREEVRAAAAWGRIVELALQEQVGAVLLSGDVADQDNTFWEAIGPLERGISRLAEAKIRTVAVAGNHDYDVLARLADQLPPKHFALLGRGGKWERLTIEEAGRPVLHIDGWSFPRARVQQSPLDDYAPGRDPAVPILGLLHGELDVAGSPYAPLELTRLQGLAPAGWLLGHVHAPRLIHGPPWVLYPGSPQALDPGEPGPHGPWVAEVAAGALGAPGHRFLSSILYEQHTIDVSQARDQTELESVLLEGIREEADRIAGEAHPNLVHVSLRLSVVGNTPVSDCVGAVADRLVQDLSLPVGSASVGVDSIDVHTMPEIDLVEYASSHSAPGAVARLLLELERPEVSPEAARVIRQARAALERIEHHRDFTPLKRRDVTDQRARDHLRTQAQALLTQLVTQTA